MKLFLVEYDNGQEYEQNDIETIGIFDSFENADKFIKSCGFFECKGYIGYYKRQHEDVLGKCIAHTDFASIEEFELNKPIDDIDYFKVHYKNK